MTYLLDVNVLVALIDPNHVGHEAAHLWFEAEGSKAWATCPITENGVIRIVGNVRYPSTPGSPAEVASIMAQMCRLPGHSFWAEDISLLNADHVDASQILTSAQVTDTFLLALAVARKGKLATFDRRLTARGVAGGKDAIHLIGNH
ncbi:TA system VapC family ribonuclease toxin [Sphingobium yanoikuyae]|uniref:TA system VapC family ribonuclease toxin n=1 Tax=Sphingobium yanoikuyae TaxID=13690 RepID=UPI0022DDF5BB|nr:TA system VapC family ribonuclease toxin [Sphingobium yanoikuyae]WBQ19080.1 PIN domain-containing protein [Sphingobium yanoikuyae]